MSRGSPVGLAAEVAPGLGAEVATLQAELVAWYGRHFRPLPWRVPPPSHPESRQPDGAPRRADAWAVWVSEVMLQQTRVESVKPYFARFMARYPSPAALAAVALDDLIGQWAGLGYYARARNLHAAAQQVVARHGGVVPDDPEAFAALAGVGRYTCGAVQSIAFGRRLPVLDGNVERVLCRLLRVEADPRQPGPRAALWAAATALADTDDPGTVNQALMELGATVCTPRAPRCLLCPWQARCAAAAAGVAAELPRKAPRPSRPVHTVVAALVRDAAGAVWLRRNPPEGLLGGLNTLPLVELPARPLAGEDPASQDPATEEPATEEPAPEDPAGLAAAARALAPLGLRPSGAPLAQVEHAFTHKVWRVTVYACAGDPAPPGAFVAPEALAEAGLSGPALKALRALKVPLGHRRGAGRA